MVQNSGRIEVNEKYELDYNFSRYDPDYEQFDRMHTMALLDKTQNGADKLVLRADNCDKGTGIWPTHVHKANGGRHFFVYCGGSQESNWESFKEEFIKQAILLIGSEHKHKLETALNNLPFEFKEDKP